MLYRSVKSSRIVIFFEMHLHHLQTPGINWQFFELTHSKRSAILSTEYKTIRELKVVIGKRLGEYIGEFKYESISDLSKIIKFRLLNQEYQ
jgi:hypothetical protein